MYWQMVVADENTVAAALECLFLFSLAHRKYRTEVGRRPNI